MLLKIRSSIAVFLILPVLFCSCTQKNNNPVTEIKNLRIPVSISDSLILSVDKSPMDMSYFPEDYPKRKMAKPDIADPDVRLIYSRPQKNGRIIFSDSSVTENVIQHYGQDWRLGANEASEIEFFKDVKINGKKVAAGRYILYCIPYADKWKMVLNKNLYSWGLHIDKSKDIAEMEIPVTKGNVQTEFFTMFFQQAAGGCVLIMSWGDVKAALPIDFN